MALLICRTCPRYDPRTTGQFGAAMAAAVAGSGIPVRNVHCLGGCPDHGVAAVDSPGKARVRFTGLDTTHADALITATTAHHASPTGTPDDWPVPTDLTDHISAVTLKRPPLA